MKFTFLANIALTDTPRRESLDGAEHLVVPAVAIREGVLNNIFYPSSELATMVEAWNGVPVPVGHPMQDDKPITANRTDVEESVNIGRFYNVMFHDNAIKGELWLNIDKATRLGFANIVESLESGEMMEISTGLLADTTPESGTFGSDSYTSIVNGIRPDHLALLPDEIGACSIEQGCGAMRTNCGGDSCSCGGTCQNSTPKQNIWQRIKGLFVKNETSHDSTRSKLYALLKSKYGEDPWPYIIDVFDTYLVYELGPDLFRESYHFENSGADIVLEGEQTKVRVEVQYVPILTNQKPKQNMDATKRSALVNALTVAMIANSQATVSDEQKAGLSALPDDVLRNMASQYKLNEDGTPLVENQPAPTPAAPAPVPTTVNAGQQSTLSDDERALLNNLKAERDARLNNKRKQVTDGHSHLTPEMVANMDETALDALIGALPQNVVAGSFGMGAAGPVRTNAENDYRPPSVFLANANDGKEQK